MTREEARIYLQSSGFSEEQIDTVEQAFKQEPCEDAISREYLFKVLDDFCGHDRTATITLDTLADLVYDMPSVKPQEPKTGQYEKHIDHTDCIWYGSDSGCPVTCSQYRDGWNDAMDYIFKNGKGYQPYRHDG